MTWAPRGPWPKPSWARPRDVSGWPHGAGAGEGAARSPWTEVSVEWRHVSSWGQMGAWWVGPGNHCPSDRVRTGSRPVLARVQEQLASRWEGNQALAARIRDQLAQHEAGLMDLREALNRAVGTTREAEELNSSNQERLEEALVRAALPRPPPLPCPPPRPCPTYRPCLSLSPCGPAHFSTLPAPEAGAVPGQCHSEGHPAGSQRQPGLGLKAPAGRGPGQGGERVSPGAAQ